MYRDTHWLFWDRASLACTRSSLTAEGIFTLVSLDGPTCLRSSGFRGLPYKISIFRSSASAAVAAAAEKMRPVLGALIRSHLETPGE